MTHFIYYHRGHDRIRIEGTITDRTPDGKRVHIEFADGDGVTVELRHLYDMDEINFEAGQYVDCLDRAKKWADAGIEASVNIENSIAYSIRDQWSGEAVDLFDMAVDRIRRENYDAAQANKIEEAEGNKSVLFQIGQLASGWLVTDHNFATEYQLTSPDGKYSVKLHTEAGYGRNYFKVLHVRNLETGRKYSASRYFHKFTTDMLGVSSELFTMFKIENYQKQLEGAN